MEQPPGNGKTARPQRARRGPRTNDEARILRTKLEGVSQERSSGIEIDISPFSYCISAPSPRKRSAIVKTSWRRGTLRILSVPLLRRRDAAIMGRAAFLAP